MKKLFLLVLIVIFCSCSKHKSYNLEVNIKGLKNMKAVVFALSAAEPKAVDTVVITNGKGSIEGTIEEPSVYRIHFEGVRDVFFIAEPGSISISGDKDNASAIKLSGTRSNDLFNSFNLEMKKVSEYGMNLMEKIKGDESEYNAISLKLDSMQTSVLKSNAINNPDSYFALVTLEPLISKVPVGEIATLFSKIPDEYKNTSLGKRLKEAISKMEKLAIGKIAPDFKSPLANGKEFQLKSNLAKVTLLDFWASWCVPCRANNPKLVELYARYKDKGFQIVGISLDRDREDWLKGIEEDRLTWVHVSSLSFWKDPVARLYNINAIPQSYLLDSKGVIVGVNLDAEALNSKVSELLK